MFFIITSGDKEKKLEFDQVRICPQCGKYGHMSIYMIYSHLSFFFIPIIKWNKRYYVKMDCCNSICELPNEIGEQIRRGNDVTIDESVLRFHSYKQIGICPYCGFKTEDYFDYCPKCGHKL